MRLLHISPHYGGGVGNVVSALCADLTAHGVDNRIISLDKSNYNPFVDSSIFFLPYHLSKDASRRISELIQDADIVLCHYWNHPLISYFLSTFHFSNTKLLFWFHTSGFHPLNPIPSRFYELPVTTIFSTSASFELIDTELTSSYLNTFSIHSTRDLSSFLSSSNERHYRSRPNNLLCIGTLSRQKLHRKSTQLFIDLAESYQITFAGDPSGSDLYNTLACHPNIRFVGFKKDIIPYLLAADCFIYPLSPDHYGTGEQVILEAMASGLPVVCLDNSPEKAIIINDQTGILCSDISDIYESTVKLMSEPTRILQFSKNSSRHIQENFSSNIQSNKFLSLIFENTTLLPQFNGCAFNFFLPDNPLSSMVNGSFSTKEIHYLNPLKNTKNILSILADLYKQKKIANLLQFDSKGSPLQYLKYFPNSPSINAICSEICF